MRRLGSVRLLVVAGLLVAVALAVLVAPLASSSPDGLERVAADEGLDAGVTEHTFAGGPFADYALRGRDDAWLGTAVSGVVGVAVTFASGLGLFTIARRRRPPASPPAPNAPAS